VNVRVGENVYFTEEYELVYTFNEEHPELPPIVWIEFIPRNGYDRGRTVRVPFEKVDSVAIGPDETDSNGKIDHGAMKDLWDDVGVHWAGDNRAWAFVNYLVNGVVYK